MTAMPRIGLVQMDVAAGRPDANVARMREHIERGRDDGLDVIVFPEMCVPGYIVGDAWEVDAIVDEFEDAGRDVVAASAEITVVFGNVATAPGELGEDGRRRKYNAAWVASDGEMVSRTGLPAPLPAGIHPKTLQPNYRFFDDDRHFYSVRKLADEHGGSVFDWLRPFSVTLRSGDAFSFGVQLCEDIWYLDYRYRGKALDTLAAWSRNGAAAVFNLSSSPWTWQKNDKRNRTIRDALRAAPVPFYYVNHVGAQNNGKNILVFDGDTTAYSKDGAVESRLPP